MKKAEDAQDLFVGQKVKISDEWREIMAGGLKPSDSVTFLGWEYCRHQEYCSKTYDFTCSGKYILESENQHRYIYCFRRIEYLPDKMILLSPIYIENYFPDELFEI